MAIRYPEDGPPRGGLDVYQQPSCIVYELAVRLQTPPAAWLVIRCHDDETLTCLYHMTKFAARQARKTP